MTELAHKNLSVALIAFQAEAPKLRRDSTNPHFKSKFTSLDMIGETIGPLLTKHGLVWQAFPTAGPNGEPALRYKLTHAASGEVEQDTMPLLLAKNDSQGLGSAITYSRRYSITAVLNLVADEDDDGAKASQRPAARQAPANGAAEGPKLLTDEQRQKVLAAITDANQPVELVLAAVSVEATDDLTVEDAKKIKALLDKATA